MIKKYRKKPIVIEAIHWNGTEELALEIVKWMCGYSERFERVARGTAKSYVKLGRISINTPEGIMTALKNDYIIKGIKGEFYPCKPDIFKETYEEVV